MQHEENNDRVAELFDSLLGRTREERADALRAEADTAVREEVASLLAAHDELAAGDDTGIADGLVARELAQLQEDLAPGTRLGSYRLRHRIGAGGMGAVYAASQDEPRRDVAVKLLLSPAARDDAQERRFRAEAAALGRLRHPNVAQILEGGVHVTADGQRIPFLAIELIPDARDLATYSSERALPLAARLALFEQVCAAVHHCHLRGVLHCDLKPSNILVDSAGVVKVIDFGIAHFVDTGDPTLTRAGLGTLAYMSPEQCARTRDELDLRVDVYALGVVLYQLVCGRLPLELRDLPPTTALRRIAEQAPTPPRALDARIAPDLEAVILRALAKHPEDRYASAAELAEELQRYRSHQPVRACRPGLARRAWLLTRRHRVLVTTTTLVTSVLVAASLVSWSYYTDARQNLDDLRLTDVFVRRILTEGRIQATRDPRVSEVLEGVTRRIDATFADRPGLRKQMLLYWGQIVQELDMREELRSLTDSLATLRDVTIDGVHPARYELMAASAATPAERELKQRHLLAAIAMLEREPDVKLLALATVNLGQLLLIGDDPAAVDAYRDRLLAIARDPRVEADQRAAAFATLGHRAVTVGQLGEARDLLERATAEFGADDEVTANLALWLQQLASLQESTGEPAAAEQTLERALTIQRQLFADKRSSTTGLILRNLGWLRRKQERWQEACEFVGAALEHFPAGSSERQRTQLLLDDVRSKLEVR